MLNSLSTTKSLIKNIKTASATSSGTNTYGSNLVGSISSNNTSGQGMCTLGTSIGTNQFTIEFWYYGINGTFGGIGGFGGYNTNKVGAASVLVLSSVIW
jgi:hypothetical protein